MFVMSRRLRNMESLRAGMFMIIVGVACATGHLDVEGLSRDTTSCAMSVVQQFTGGRPYLRGLSSKQPFTGVLEGSYTVACGPAADSSSCVLVTASRVFTSTTCPAVEMPAAPSIGTANYSQYNDTADRSPPPTILTIRVAGTSMRGCHGAAATTVAMASSSISVSLDPETYGLFQAYQQYYTSAHAAAINSGLATQYGFNSQGCPHSSEVYSSKVVASSHTMIDRAPAFPKNLSAAASLLLPTSPASCQTSLRGGGIANAPAPLQASLSCGKHLLQASPVSICSYTQSSDWGMATACTWIAGGAPIAIGALQQVYKAGHVNQPLAYQQHYTSAHAAAANSALATQSGSNSQEGPQPSKAYSSTVVASSHMMLNHAPVFPKYLSAADSLLLSTSPASCEISLGGGGIAPLQVSLSCGKHLLQASPAPTCSYMQRSAWGMATAWELPQQVHKADFGNMLLTVFYCQPSPKIKVSCGANPVPHTAVEFGLVKPCAEESLSSLSSAPLAPLSASPHHLRDSSASPAKHTLRPALTGASLLGYQSDPAMPVSCASSSTAPLLCNIPSHGQNAMPRKVYQAVMEYYTTACVAAVNLAMSERNRGKIQGCDSNLPWLLACLFINLATSTAGCASVAGLWLAGLWLFGQFVQSDPGGQAVGQSCVNCIQQLTTLHVLKWYYVNKACAVIEDALMMAAQLQPPNRQDMRPL